MCCGCSICFCNLYAANLHIIFRVSQCLRPFLCLLRQKMRLRGGWLCGRGSLSWRKVGLVRGCHDVSSWFAALCLGLKMGLRRGWRGRRGEGQAVWAWQRGGSASENAARCICHCTALRCPTQRAASVIAPRWVSWDGAEQVGGNRFGSLLPARPSGLVARLAGGGGSLSLIHI